MKCRQKTVLFGPDRLGFDAKLCRLLPPECLSTSLIPNFITVKVESAPQDPQKQLAVSYHLHRSRHTSARVEENMLGYLHDFGDTEELLKQT